MKIIDFAKKIINYISYILSEVFYKIFVIGNLYEKDLSSILHDLKPGIEGAFSVIDNVSDLTIFKDNFSHKTYEAYKGYLLKYRDRMLVFIVNGKLISWIWFTLGRNRYYEPDIGQEITIPNDAVYCFDAYTKMDYEGKGIYAASLSYLSSLLLKFNKKKLIFVVLTSNKAPIYYTKKLNFKIIKKFLLINLGILKLKFKFL